MQFAAVSRERHALERSGTMPVYYGSSTHLRCIAESRILHGIRRMLDIRTYTRRAIRRSATFFGSVAYIARSLYTAAAWAQNSWCLGIHNEATFRAITNAASNGLLSSKSVLDETASVR